MDIKQGKVTMNRNNGLVLHRSRELPHGMDEASPLSITASHTKSLKPGSQCLDSAILCIDVTPKNCKILHKNI